MMESGGDPAQIAADRGYEAMDSGDLERVIDDAIAAHPDEWSRYCGGEEKLTGLFIGAIKKATDGKADLKSASALLRARQRSQ
jgi:aspartyl-tRNA(Asn)/glutamyl-tRNA(Gln) amidotransferase subunit B